MSPLAAVMAAAVLGQVEPEVVLDARVVTSRGQAVSLEARWGKPTVLFYEDRHSTALNQALKDELFARGKREGLLDAVTVLAVANLQGFDWFPARDFALKAVRDAEAKAGISVYADWQGALTKAPWRLSATTSNVVVLDAKGRLVLQAQGALDAQARERVLAALSTQVTSVPRPTSPTDL